MRLIAICFAVPCIAFAGAVAASAQTPPADADTDDKTLTVDVYTLDTCPVSGQELGSMGEPVVKEYDGREVRLCCANCVGRFEQETEKYFAEIDKKLIEQQLPYYPLEGCIVSGRKLEDLDTAVDLIHQGRLVRFCCDRCPTRFQADPDQFMTRLDEAIIQQQRDNYPLDTCVVADNDLGSMGDPDEIIVGGLLVRLCCEGCRAGFKKDPVKHLATIRQAWADRHDQDE